MVAQQIAVRALLHATGTDVLTLRSGNPVSEVNVVGKTKKVDTERFLLDDGTSTIAVQRLNNPTSINEGEVVRVLGNIRMFGPPCIVASIIKPCEERWMPKVDHRMLALIKTLEEDHLSYEEVLARVGDRTTLDRLIRLELVFEDQGLHALDKE
ncbi:MAG: hypothetical protein QF486_04640 [Candidatus Woesearchaeota archaeon]|jgi:hypothetical protein|nr:hypothetical protein [Candidatus Woesearchaeota archaeon]MDP7181789.1 hypothetical protein [Candidatus Woesearchaeota archaeon]MDP7198878.1 hypothetical protein [Candidatus Woesearchaeota archaeon]MDP7467122.1 hypothetical protein [Candidatus Woesearchaeota archaeon]MDP7647543.1 hypothetical protein [Candidatus Woesearchaeota archaeon]